MLREPHYGTVMVTGYEEALELYKQGDTFSSCLAVTGPIPGLPFKPAGDDISEQIEQHRPQVPWATHFITFDGPEHAAHRGLLTRLLTFERLRKNAEYVEKLADRLIDRFIARGKCEIVSEYSQPLATLVIADLLGVPEEDRGRARGDDRSAAGHGRKAASTRARRILWIISTGASPPISRSVVTSPAMT